MGRTSSLFLASSFLLALAGAIRAQDAERAPILDKRARLDLETFWDNRDWDWYERNIPFFECPDAAINTAYYYRWELVTKHLVYGSPATGYALTEFIDRPFWSGTFGAISCPAGHQLQEIRWLRNPRYARDYSRYWFQTPGAQPRRYSCWIADAIWGLHQVHPDAAFVVGLLPALKENYQGWERERFDPEVGLFWQTGHDDGMETNINSRQTKDWLRGAPGYRPTLNSYLWADAQAIAKTAELAGDLPTALLFRRKSDAIKANLQRKLWDPKRDFFFHMSRNDEEKDGFVVKKGTLTYQTGRFAGSDRGRELIGYVPWQFGLVDQGFESAWKPLMDRDSFFADFGPTVVERKDPQFLISKNCCVWSGQSWPYATAQTLKALAVLLRDYPRNFVSKEDYFTLFSIYTKTQRKNGRPYIAEAAHPDTGSWEGHDSYNHSEHYFHSCYNDLLITGLVGLRPRDDETIEVEPLAPDDWDYFALDDVSYRGRDVSVVWDKTGERYGLGKGLRIFADGREIGSSPTLGRLVAALPPARNRSARRTEPINVAVNNDGGYFPRISASFTATDTAAGKAIDGNYWYHLSPPNRWTAQGSPNERDWVAIDFGVKRRIDTVKLYLLDDGETIAPPRSIELDYWTGSKWASIPSQTRTPEAPIGRRANRIRFPELETSKIRAVFRQRPGTRTGLTEFEAWGTGSQTISPAPPPTGNLAFRPPGQRFPKVSATFTSRFDAVEEVNDGRVNFSPNPRNRWTCFESPHPRDRLELDFGSPQTVGRVEIAVYDDGGGVQAPASIAVEIWNGSAWVEVEDVRQQPDRPVGGQFFEIGFRPVRTSKLRLIFTHRGRGRSGATEIFAWPE